MNILQICSFVFWINIASKNFKKNNNFEAYKCILRANGIRCCYCIDDSLHLIINPTFVTDEKQTEIVISELQNLGFTINDKKSVIIPSQRIVLFGVIIDSEEFKVF